MTEARRQRGSRAAATGVGAEAIAAQLLTAEGWVVLARRARTPAGEIDLIAERDGLLVFIEVKARPSLVEAAYALGPRQRARLIGGAEAWLAANPGHGVAGMRFDVILVAGDSSARRVADAFRIGDL
ncbi:MAG: endonuclease [Rhodospirillales bacterium]|nr:endonuclease [Rhodospirillales bacterium]